MERIAGRLRRRAREGRPGESVREVCRVGREQARFAKELMLQTTIEEAVTDALGPKRGPRKTGLTPWECGGCGPRRGDQLRRNGHYRRQLLVIEGAVELQMPQLVCVDCRKSVAVKHEFIARGQRIWLDVQQRIACLYLEGCSYRATRRLLGRDCGSSIGLMSIWRCFQAVGQLPRVLPTHPPSRYILLDEVYHKVHGEGRWYLCARARDEKGGLHWMGSVASAERSQEAWERLLDGLGISRYNPPFAVISDGDRAIEEAVRKCLPGVKLHRCTWHLKHNAAEWISERYPKNEDEGQRKGLMAAVHSIVDAGTLEQRAASLAVLREGFAWLAERLSHVLERVPPRSPDHPIRTNNGIERGFRELRRRTRPMDGFGSDAGAENFLNLWMLKENARVNGRDYLLELIP